MSVESDPLGPVLDGALGVHEATFKWGEATAADLIAAGVKHIGEDPNIVHFDSDQDGNTVEYSVWELIPDHMTLPNAVRRVRAQMNNVGPGQNKRDIIAFASWKYLSAEGEFFHTPEGHVYYFYDDEKKVYRVTGDGSAEVTQEFRALVHELTGLSTGQDGNAALVQIHDRAKRNSPEREMHKFASWDEDAEVLYITDFDDGYYRLDGSSIRHCDNGEHVFFADYTGEKYEYLPPSERASFSDRVPGELPKWHKAGDLLMRFFGNRTNFDPSAILKKEQQRTQMYVHLHAMAFIDYFTAKPITAFVGEKGSGKTVVQRSVGKFLFGGDWKESMMPSDREDFAAIVNNRPLAFVDNFDQAVDWANDILASTATGSADIRRELYTTMGMAQTTPDCFIALTSRDPPFRRDDVADRTVVFRVTRLDSFIGMRGFLNPVTDNRDSLWSVFLDNLNDIVAEMQSTDMESMVSTHRMSDWAAFAKVVGEALDIDGVDDTLEVMQKERALFALEDDPLFRTVREWLNKRGASVRGEDWTAGDLLDELQDFAEDNNIDFTYQRSQTLGKRLGNVEEEMDELFGFESDTSSRTNKYRFIDPTAGGGRQGVLGYGHFDSDDNDDNDDDDDPDTGSASDTDDNDGGGGPGQEDTTEHTLESGDGSATEDNGGATEDDGSTADHPPQNERKAEIHEYVGEHEDNFDGGVPEDVIVDMLTSRGHPEPKIRNDIKQLKKQGDLYEPQEPGKVKVVS